MVWGINSLFTVGYYLIVISAIDELFMQDLLNFDDPLNKEAADLYTESKVQFMYGIV